MVLDKNGEQRIFYVKNIFVYLFKIKVYNLRYQRREQGKSYKFTFNGISIAMFNYKSAMGSVKWNILESLIGV